VRLANALRSGGVAARLIHVDEYVWSAARLQGKVRARGSLRKSDELGPRIEFRKSHLLVRVRAGEALGARARCMVQI
jgi:hypothetical protein